MAVNPPAPATEELTYCAVHPDRETGLRCNKCGRLMCAQCAVSTPVGYRCRECVRQHDNKFFNVNQYDYPLVFAVCLGLSVIGGYLASEIDFALLWIIASVPVGGIIAEAALRVTQRRRGRYSGQVGAGGVVAGGLLGGLIHGYVNFVQPYQAAVGELPAEVLEELGADGIDPWQLVFQSMTNNIGLLIFIGVAAFFVYQRFRTRVGR
jgi:MFS family permease